MTGIGSKYIQCFVCRKRSGVAIVLLSALLLTLSSQLYSDK